MGPFRAISNKSNYSVISMTYEFAVLFRLARQEIKDLALVRVKLPRAAEVKATLPGKITNQ
jgi:hypothetical protein